MEHTVKNFLHEAFIDSGIGLFIICVRLVVRIRTVGLRNYDWDDYVMITVLGTLSINTLAVQRVIYYGGTNTHLTDAERAALTPAEIASFVMGTKWFFVGQFFYVSTIWSTKFCMAIFLGRLTKGLRRHRWVIFVHILNTISFVTICLVLMFSCMPISHRWQVVPAPPIKCQVDSPHSEVLSTPFNVIVDIFLIAIPVPLLWRSSMPFGRKLGLCILLCGGVATIVAVLLRTCLSIIASNSTSTIPAVWTVREYLIAIIVTNAPLIKPLFSSAFWRRGSYLPSVVRSDFVESYDSNGKSLTATSTLRRVYSTEDGQNPLTAMSDLKIQRHQEFEVSSQIQLTREEEAEYMQHGMQLQPWKGGCKSDVQTLSRKNPD